MIVKKTENGIVHIHSDAGKRIRQKGAKMSFSEAYEKEGAEHEWEEVDE